MPSGMPSSIHMNLAPDVIDGAMEFIAHATNELWDERLTPAQRLKFSTIDLYTGIELLLKARLMQEHWTLVLRDPDRYRQESFLEGDFNSVTYQQGRKRLSDLCGIDLDEAAHNAFDQLRTLRNRYVHFRCDEPEPKVQAVQLSAWHHVLQLLETGFLGQLTREQSVATDEVKAVMLRSEHFLDERLAQAQGRLVAATSSGLLVGTCPTCQRKSLVIGDGFPDCLVCGEYEASPARLASAYAKLTNPFWMHPRHGPDDQVAWCGECENEAIVPAGAELLEDAPTSIGPDSGGLYVCMVCGLFSLPSDIDQCPRCGSSYTGSGMICPACTV